MFFKSFLFKPGHMNEKFSDRNSSHSDTLLNYFKLFSYRRDHEIFWSNIRIVRHNDVNWTREVGAHADNIAIIFLPILHRLHGIIIIYLRVIHCDAKSELGANLNILTHFNFELL